MSAPGDTTVIETKQNSSRMVLFLLLVLATSIPLFFPLTVPNRPVAATMSLYSTVMAVPDGSTVIVQSDWTNSTRAESAGEMESLCRILMRKNCKIAFYSAADPQAPQVARNTIIRLNEERKSRKEPIYVRWTNYVNVGFFPNAEGANNAMAADLRKAWAGKKEVNTQGVPTDVFQSPVLENVHSVNDVPLMVIVTASSSFNIFIERISSTKVPIIAMVTGVMGPESQVYYASGQLKGLASGMQGVYDLETMMENGINEVGPDNKVAVPWPGHDEVKSWRGYLNFAKGKLYYPTLHVALVLLILSVVAGNINMLRARRRVQR